MKNSLGLPLIHIRGCPGSLWKLLVVHQRYIVPTPLQCLCATFVWLHGRFTFDQTQVKGFTKAAVTAWDTSSKVNVKGVFCALCFEIIYILRGVHIYLFVVPDSKEMFRCNSADLCKQNKIVNQWLLFKNKLFRKRIERPGISLVLDKCSIVFVGQTR